MPVFASGKGRAPSWCQLEYFDIVELCAGERHVFERVGLKEKLIVGKGRCNVSFADQTVQAEEGADLDLTSPEGWFEISEVTEKTTLIRMAGRWGDQLGGSGIFRVSQGERTEERGSPVDYPKATNFDNHYHDCDEYWIIFEGRGEVVSEGRHFQVAVGDCLATGMGHHHDLPHALEPVRGVYFETTMEGQKRADHLWTHTHGPAAPRPERV